MSFAKTGTYTYYCVLHPNMVGTVTVTGDTQDSQQKITKTGNQQKAQYLKEGEAAKTKLADGQAQAARRTPTAPPPTPSRWARRRAHTDVLAFSPTPKKVKAGDQVTFVNNSAAPHTASFGGTLVPTDPDAPTTCCSRSPARRRRRSRRACTSTPGGCRRRPSRARRSPPAATPTRCPAPGTYTYACVLHLPSGMAGEIDAS